MLDVLVHVTASAACMFQDHGFELQNLVSKLGDLMREHAVSLKSTLFLLLKLRN